MARILFVRETMLDRGVQLSTNHLFRAAAELGHDVLWLTRPATPLTILNAVRSPEARRRIALAASALAGRRGRQFCFFTPIIRKKQLGLTGDALLRSMVRLALPPLRSALRSRAWTDIDLLWFSDPQLVGAIRAMPHRILAFQVTDDYTSFPNYAGDLEHALRKLLSSADVVFFTNRALLSAYAGRFGMPLQRCAYIGHGIERYFERTVPPPETSIDVVYIGALNDWLDWDALERIRSRLPRLRLHFFGQASPDIRRKIQTIGFYGGYLPRERVPETLSNYHFGIIPFRRSGLKAFSEPMKLYDYIASGLPVLSFIEIDPHLRAAFPESIAVAEDVESAACFLARRGGEYAELRRKHMDAAARFAAENSWRQRFTAAYDFALQTAARERAPSELGTCADAVPEREL